MTTAKKHKFKIAMLAIGFLCILCVSWAFWTYSYLERDLIFDKICHPTYIVILGMASLALAIYIAYVEEYRSSKFIIAVVFGFIGCAVLLSLVSFAMVAVSNEIFWGSDTIVVQGKVIEAMDWKGDNHGRRYHSIKVYCHQLQRDIELDVPRSYKNGEFFSREMRLGRWGIVYKHPF